MIDFSKLLTPGQKANIAKRKAEEARRTVGTITAYDERGNTFQKTVMLSPGLRIIDFGWPARYDLEQLIDGVKNNRKDLCIDMAGRNHKGSPVRVRFADLWLLLDKAKILAETLKAERT